MSLESVLQFLKRLFQGPNKTSQISEVEEDIKEVLEDYKEDKIISEFEEKVILNVLNLKTAEVREFTISRVELVGIRVDSSWEEILEIITRSSFSFYPVYEKSLDHPIGYITLRDLIKGFIIKSYSWQDRIKKPLIIPEHIPVINALEKMVEKREEIAFVVDELSEITGMVRLKDILLELVKPQPVCPIPDSEGWIIVPGTCKIREIENCLGIELPKGNFETVSGLIIDSIRKIPKSGDLIHIPPLEIKVIKSDEKKISLVKLRKKT